jgi:hypothetical protein
MYRDHVWISTLRRLLVAQILVLLSAAAWGQQIFGDYIQGGAASCKPVSYDISGNVMNGYDIHDKKTAPRCAGLGPATTGSSAKVGPPYVTSLTTATKSIEADGFAEEESFDTAILTPPNGWKGSVPVTLKTAYTFSVQGASATRPAFFILDYYIDSVLKWQASETHGHHTYNFGFDFDVLPSETGTYEFLVTIAGETDAFANPYGGSSASCSTSFMYFVLPKGWTCEWRSNGAACGVS